MKYVLKYRTLDSLLCATFTGSLIGFLGTVAAKALFGLTNTFHVLSVFIFLAIAPTICSWFLYMKIMEHNEKLELCRAGTVKDTVLQSSSIVISLFGLFLIADICYFRFFIGEYGSVSLLWFVVYIFIAIAVGGFTLLLRK